MSRRRVLLVEDEEGPPDFACYSGGKYFGLGKESDFESWSMVIFWGGEAFEDLSH